MNPALGNIGTTTARAAAEKQQQTLDKSKGSEFEKVRSRLKTDSVASTAPAAEAKNISAAQQPNAVADARAVREVFQPAIERASRRIDALRPKIDALPRTSAFDPLRARFTSVENLFRRSASLLNGLEGADSPADMMKIQMHMYKLSGNIELMAKVVEQVNSGVKTVLQTQV